MARTLVPEGGHPVRARVELERVPGTLDRRRATPGWGVRPIEERLDMLGGPLVHQFIVMVLGERELPCPAWP
jgi:hypothetical protein